ncbi:MAG TPA: NUDIX hydrolase [Chitinophagaceae bacterium]|nr:NUDIX hydrolase [Chitinophagaceae bacterium]MCC6634851.1 NUDIX hydrolase [Chitinophagaceae bacterium]HMZ46481.1 NUDIX hydrolase [Chitinophagaceae bacterium]HNJ58873.1 NUDIX hydrolase [Chitinophagaceae bacterium]HNL81909.1 NUDIX hydrolase [Chitinophagaceae bacterium]
MMRDLNWKTLSSKYIYKDRWFIARADSCLMANGKTIEPYYVLEFPNWCNVIVVTNKEEIVMVRQYRHAINKTTIELPGGVIDKNENPKEAAIREVLEETGYTIHQIEFLYATAPNPATNNNMAYFFLAKANENLQCQQPDPFEDLDVILVDKKEVLEMIHNSQIIHGVQIGAIYAAYQKLGWIEQKI